MLFASRKTSHLGSVFNLQLSEEDAVNVVILQVKEVNTFLTH